MERAALARRAANTLRADRCYHAQPTGGRIGCARHVMSESAAVCAAAAAFLTQTVALNDTTVKFGESATSLPLACPAN